MALDTITLPVPPKWHQAARYLGHKNVRVWVRCVVEVFLETGGRFFPILPLKWKRTTFDAIQAKWGQGGQEYAPHEVRGWTSGPFGIYHGCHVAGSSEGFTLAHLPTGRKLATLNLARDCRKLAEELAGLRIGWHQIEPEKVGGPDSEKVTALIARYEEAAHPVRSHYTAGVGGRPR